MSAIASGIALNCVPVVVYGIRAWRENRVKGVRIGSFWNREAREQLRRENPHMLRDTLALTAATLLPFATLAAVLFDAVRACKR